MAHYQVIIIGSGFGGQTSAINLLKRNINDFLILERRNFMGGTWCQNSYPGAAVDVQSPLYSISFEPYPWSQMFADGKELQEYTHYVIDKYRLRDKTQLNTNVDKLSWDNKEKHWVIATNTGEYTAQFVINASGPLSTPVIPPFKGKDSFKGESFHTNNWNHNYDYKGKKVAIIGSGASAAQVIPELAKDAEHLYVFQRSPHWVMPRHDKVFKPWQRKLLKIKPLHKLLRYSIYWGLESRILAFKYSDTAMKLFAQNKAEKFLNSQIKDQTLLKKLTPNYTIGCKRIILSNTLYPALSQDNVTLLDKDQAIAEITETGIETLDGQTLDLDLIVYSTGYDATDGLISYPVIGKDGSSIQEFWYDYPRAYLGTTAPNFPNYFVVTGPNTGIGHTSAIVIIEAQMHYIMKSILETHKQNAKAISVNTDAEDKYTSMIHDEMKKTVWHTGGCTSWYQSKSGKVIAMFPGFTFTYIALTKKFRPEHHTFDS